MSTWGSFGGYFFMIKQQQEDHMPLSKPITMTSQWAPWRLKRRRLHCLPSRLFRCTSKPRVPGLCEGNPLVTGGFPSKKASNAENVFICLRHHAISPKTVEFYYPPRRRRCLSADENVILTKFFSLAALKIIILQPVMKISSIWRHLSFSVTKIFRRLKACRTIITSTTLFNHTTDEAK